MPLAIYVLGLMIFSMTTSEFMVAGIMPSLSEEFGVSVAAIGYLISAYAAGMIIGGPLLTVGLLKVPRKKAFLALSAVFLIGQTLGALAPNYELMMAARIITGVASSACFGVSIAIALTLVRPEASGRAASIVLGGLMVATAVGLPAAMLFDQYFGWRASFWAVVVLVLVSGTMGLLLIPKSPKEESASISLRTELAAFNNRHLWAAFATSMLIIGATFAAFSYFSPILTDVAGFGGSMVPLLLGVYGVATVIGNTITGRLADRYMMPILTIGLAVLTGALLMFGIFAAHQVVAVIAVIVIGLVGVSMNPAMVTRVARTSNSGSLVSTFHVSVVNFGIVVGSTIGGLTIDHGYGLASPLWVGAVLAVLGLLSLVPYLKKTPAPADSAAVPGKNCA
ncbi:putative MFS family arabinose efflux permease [Paenibacillus rhizosphaerae]|uniref:Putative MFS family arabinose efflux permease n=1 Tax=Paenibacillus rhizosphaerae TaxID=297318 RepID=A0A839TLF5_9BACL|nr:MFS transporter [Paenibacillus rhizosphaerae]MBB3126228.1 putative MFS family arabinose efflux permease [Paenibacillus rhizosphaerae]